MDRPSARTRTVRRTTTNPVRSCAGKLRGLPNAAGGRDLSRDTQTGVCPPDGDARRSIQYRLESYGGDIYLLAANIAAEPLTVEFRGLPVGASELEVLFEGRKVSLSGRALRDSFAPYEVHVYKALDYRQVLPLILRR